MILGQKDKHGRFQRFFVFVSDDEVVKNANNEIICEALNKQLKEIEFELEKILKKLL